jgi:SAM-dependent methyltransferase
MKSCIDFYDDSADAWAEEWYQNETALPYLKKLVEYTHNTKPRILDMCCSAGYQCMRLKNLGAEVVGADLSEKSLEIARQKNPTIPFYQKDMLLSYADLGKFDAISWVGGIIHLEENQLDTALSNMAQVLDKGGLLLLVFIEKGEEVKPVEVNGEVYARSFIYHTKAEIEKYADKYFEFIEDLTLPDDPTGWRYCIYKRV